MDGWILDLNTFFKVNIYKNPQSIEWKSNTRYLILQSNVEGVEGLATYNR